jgi:hypothetical protein
MSFDEPQTQSDLYPPKAVTGASSPTEGDQGNDGSGIGSGNSQNPPTASAKVNMDPKFQDRLNDLRDHAKKESDDRKLGNQVKWFRPKDWDGDLFQWQQIEDPFKRDQANNEGVDAIKSPKAPGVTGDVVAASTMIETLSLQERAFRVRHTMRRPRAVAHMLSRKKGHGDPKGAFQQNGIEYINQILKQSRVPQ